MTGASSIDGLGSTNGETATVTGTFNAASAGLNTVTITATDSDGATTQLDIVINVLGINLHPSRWRLRQARSLAFVLAPSWRLWPTH